MEKKGIYEICYTNAQGAMKGQQEEFICIAITEREAMEMFLNSEVKIFPPFYILSNKKIFPPNKHDI